MRKTAAPALAFVLVALGASCSSEAPLVVPGGCQPLEGELSCTLPYPSDFFRPAAGPVALQGAAKPATRTDVDADLVTPLGVDGFSRQPGIVAVLPSAVVGDGLPNVLDDPSRSMDLAASPTLLLRADTGEAVAHYADVDTAPDDDTHVAISIYPFVQLAEHTRYIVALRGVKSADGSLAAPAEGFRRLRDRDTSRDPSLAAIAPRFDSDVFGPLESKGVARSSLQLAWDFTTAGADTPRADMLDLRAAVQAWLAQNTPAVTVTGTDPPSAQYASVVHGTVTVPLYLDKPDSGGRLFRGADGKIAQNGTTVVPFVVVIPTTVTSQTGPGRALAFGHGFFGSTDEILGQEAATLISTLHAVGVAIDWWGMSKADLGTVIGLLTTTPAQGGTFVERVYQAMANWMVVTRAMRTSLSTRPELERSPGQPLYDPSHVYYFGASMGHILGGTMSALDPDIERAVLNVGGASWEQMMPRAGPFAGLDFFIKSTMKSELDTKTMDAMLASALDRIDPATYAAFLIGSSLPGNPDRKVILQTGLGDAEVPNCASYFHARTLGLSMVQPSPQTAWGIPLADAASLSSAITVWDFGIDPNVYRTATPPAPNPVHDGLRNVPAAMAQMDAFLQPNGTVIDPCTGPCTSK